MHLESVQEQLGALGEKHRNLRASYSEQSTTIVQLRIKVAELDAEVRALTGQFAQNCQVGQGGQGGQSGQSGQGQGQSQNAGHSHTLTTYSLSPPEQARFDKFDAFSQPSIPFDDGGGGGGNGGQPAPLYPYPTQLHGSIPRSNDASTSGSANSAPSSFDNLCGPEDLSYMDMSMDMSWFSPSPSQKLKTRPLCR